MTLLMQTFLTMSSTAQDFPHDLVSPRCISVFWLRDVPCLRSTAGDQVLQLQLHSSWPFFVLSLARQNDCFPLVSPSALWHSKGMGRVCSSRAQAVLSNPVHFSVILDHWEMKHEDQFAFHISPRDCSTCPSSYPTKSQLTLVCMPAGMDMVIFVLFSTVNNSAFDYIIFWGYSH